MFENLIAVRNCIIQKKYQWILKPIFFLFDPEDTHDYASALGQFLGKYSLTRKITAFFFGYTRSSLGQNILGIYFKNPVGLSAGFDKNATLTDILPAVGFGFMEVGSITGEPCSGNPRPRLWRLKKSQSLAIYYGLKNDGCEAIAKRLMTKKFAIPLGVNIAKTNCQETTDTNVAVLDYFKAYQAFSDIGDYVTINISCPSAFGGQPFTDPAKLEILLQKIMSISKKKPIFLKISPDLNPMEVDNIIEVAKRFQIDGFVCTNLTKNRDNPKILDKDIPAEGGLSGKVVGDLSLKLIRYIYKKTNGKFVIIASGGIFNAEDAYERIKAGASLLQLITGMIYQGPQVVSEINFKLARLLERDGYPSIAEAVGKE